jgi:protoheme ferro-lyase
MSRTAIVLFNLGGPDFLEAARPFLAPVARDIYGKMGNRVRR